jgi:hypothetical protein
MTFFCTRNHFNTRTCAVTGAVALLACRGHGTAGCTNVSWIEAYATPRKS